MSLDAYVSLGRTGLFVSPFALGTMTFGEDWGWGADDATSATILSRYLEMGGNFIDTANGYTFGHAEKIIGDYLGQHKAERERLVIATKFGTSMHPGDPNAGGASSKSIIRACEQSLRRLQTDYIDLYWMHFPDPYTPIEETLRTLEQLVSSGKVRYIGFSDSPAWKVAQAQTIATLRGWTPLAGIQLEYSLLERSVETELIPMAQELGLGVVAWSPLANGMLSGKYNRNNAGNVAGSRATQFGVPFGEHEFALIDALTDIANRHETNVAAIALAWVRARAGVSSTLLGARTVAHLDANIKALEVQLKVEDIQMLDNLSTPPLTFIPKVAGLADLLMYHGTSVNGQTRPAWWGAPPSAAAIY
ncbi:aldo/keto reductase [Silvimonas amylolytica]|uniref:Aldo/keto reductase n=1 Tax=Silvimonas amylolytica TaxID=449663 RepID=A0ABQ2PNI9_9NEIS|nr:aldo/keto reductase [Silvimonas amylolytica]GGP26881.1 aldo/keto reductase [Silvimonas amylolytica]